MGGEGPARGPAVDRDLVPRVPGVARALPRAACPRSRRRSARRSVREGTAAPPPAAAGGRLAARRGGGGGGGDGGAVEAERGGARAGPGRGPPRRGEQARRSRPAPSSGRYPPAPASPTRARASRSRTRRKAGGPWSRHSGGPPRRASSRLTRRHGAQRPEPRRPLAGRLHLLRKGPAVGERRPPGPPTIGGQRPPGSPPAARLHARGRGAPHLVARASARIRLLPVPDGQEIRWLPANPKAEANGGWWGAQGWAVLRDGVQVIRAGDGLEPLRDDRHRGLALRRGDASRSRVVATPHGDTIAGCERLPDRVLARRAGRGSTRGRAGRYGRAGSRVWRSTSRPPRARRWN